MDGAPDQLGALRHRAVVQIAQCQHRAVMFGQAGENVFVHRADVMSADGRPVLVPGMQVTYELGAGKDGRPRAQSVRSGARKTARKVEIK